MVVVLFAGGGGQIRNSLVEFFDAWNGVGVGSTRGVAKVEELLGVVQ